jgi:hypothetical protein
MYRVHLWTLKAWTALSIPSSRDSTGMGTRILSFYTSSLIVTEVLRRVDFRSQP